MLDVCDFYNEVIIAPGAYGLFINKTETLNCFLPLKTNIPLSPEKKYASENLVC